MSGYQLPVAERINRRELEIRPRVPGSALVAFGQFREAARASVRVNADECAAWASAGDLQRWASGPAHNPLNLMGPLRAPFSSLWVEWTHPQLPKVRHAAWVVADDPGQDAAPGSVQTLMGIVLVAKGRLAVYEPVWTALDVDDHGRALQITTSVDPHSEAAQRARAEMIVPCIAIGFMNCRNVEVAVTEPLRQPPPKKGRRAVKPLEQHVIRLPGPARTRTLAEAKEAAGGEAPLHVVRGHFKTYTEDAPLLGKHTGTWWWAAAARGDASAGQHSTSYRVGPPRDPA